jgi:hypothetical protein
MTDVGTLAHDVLALQPPDIKVEVEDLTVVQVSRTVFCLRNTSADRVKYEIEFGLKRGSTDNSYLIKARRCGAHPCPGCSPHNMQLRRGARTPRY